MAMRLRHTPPIQMRRLLVKRLMRLLLMTAMFVALMGATVFSPFGPIRPTPALSPFAPPTALSPLSALLVPVPFRPVTTPDLCVRTVRLTFRPLDTFWVRSVRVATDRVVTDRVVTGRAVNERPPAPPMRAAEKSVGPAARAKIARWSEISPASAVSPPLAAPPRIGRLIASRPAAANAPVILRIVFPLLRRLRAPRPHCVGPAQILAHLAHATSGAARQRRGRIRNLHARTLGCRGNSRNRSGAYVVEKPGSGPAATGGFHTRVNAGGERGR